MAGGASSAGDSSSYGEPLYGVAAIPAGQASELITTPGNVQQAVINVNGALKYAAILYPYNWDPTTWASPGQTNSNADLLDGLQAEQALPALPARVRSQRDLRRLGRRRDPRRSRPVGSSGAEAPEIGYANNYNLNGDPLNVAPYATTPFETDWYHPFNPGNPMGYVPLTAIVHSNANRATLMGKASYFNPEFPRLKVMLNAHGSRLCVGRRADVAVVRVQLLPELRPPPISACRSTRSGTRAPACRRNRSPVTR